VILYSYTLQIHYTARFADGIVFDSSYKRARPLTMRIGVGKVDKFYLLLVFDSICLVWTYKAECGFQVIRGLDQGILGGEGVPPMRIGIKFYFILTFIVHGICHLLNFFTIFT